MMTFSITVPVLLIAKPFAITILNYSGLCVAKPRRLNQLEIDDEVKEATYEYTGLLLLLSPEGHAASKNPRNNEFKLPTSDYERRGRDCCELVKNELNFNHSIEPNFSVITVLTSKFTFDQTKPKGFQAKQFNIPFRAAAAFGRYKKRSHDVVASCSRNHESLSAQY